MTTESIFHIAFWGLFGGLLVMRVYFSLRVRRAKERLMPDREAIEREGRGMFAARVVAFLFLIVLLALYALNSPWIEALSIPLPGWLRWAGFALGIFAVVLWSWAQIHLDTQWSAQLQLKDNHRLVTTGPYARIRHPLYTGMFGWCVSLPLLTANWIFLGICALSLAGLLWRVPKEEQMMIEAFGDEYKAYMQRTGRFFPKISKNK